MGALPLRKGPPGRGSSLGRGPETGDAQRAWLQSRMEEGAGRGRKGLHHGAAGWAPRGLCPAEVKSFGGWAALGL